VGIVCQSDDIILFLRFTNLILEVGKRKESNTVNAAV